MFTKFHIVSFFKKSTLMAVNVVLVVENRDQCFYSPRVKRKPRQEDNAPSPSCEVCREHTDVTSPEAVGVLAHKDRIFVGDLAKCYCSKFTKRKGGLLSCVCLFSSLGRLSPPWSLQEVCTFSPRPLSILYRAAWCWCFHQREVRGKIPCQNSGQRSSFV